MELETDQRCGAERYERSEQRVNRRNGYRERSIETRIGKLDLKIPNLRSGSYYPSFLEPRKSSERALVAVVQEAYVKGISTRKVDDLVQAIGMSGISKSQVSRLCQDIDKRVTRLLERPVLGEWPYLWLDATYLKSREDGHVVSRALVIAVGVTAYLAKSTGGGPYLFLQSPESLPGEPILRPMAGLYQTRNSHLASNSTNHAQTAGSTSYIPTETLGGHCAAT